MTERTGTVRRASTADCSSQRDDGTGTMKIRSSWQADPSRPCRARRRWRFKTGNRRRGGEPPDFPETCLTDKMIKQRTRFMQEAGSFFMADTTTRQALNARQTARSRSNGTESGNRHSRERYSLRDRFESFLPSGRDSRPFLTRVGMAGV